MTEEQKSEAWNQMWRNFCVSDSFEPGFPAKPLTVAAALEEGSSVPRKPLSVTAPRRWAATGSSASAFTATASFRWSRP